MDSFYVTIFVVLLFYFALQFRASRRLNEVSETLRTGINLIYEASINHMYEDDSWRWEAHDAVRERTFSHGFLWLSLEPVTLETIYGDNPPWGDKPL